MTSRIAAAVLIAAAALTITACGSADAPRVAPTTAQSASRVPVMPQVQDMDPEPSAECTVTGDRLLAMWRALPSADSPVGERIAAMDAFLSDLPAESEACDETARLTIRNLRQSAIANLAEWKQATQG